MRTNPITQRLGQLSDQWARFAANDAARVLLWQLTAAEVRMLDAFVELESDERTAEHATLFMTLDSPFEGAAAHGRSLAEKLWEGMIQGEPELRELGLPAGWRLPAPQHQERDAAYLVRCCLAFLSDFEVPGQLALILRPSACADVTAYAQWLLTLAAATPEVVRFVVFDDAAAPQLAELARSGDRRIVSERAALDLPSALVELSEAAGKLDTPGGKYRDQLVRMTAALQAGELGRAIAHVDAAVEVAAAHELWQLVVPVQVALGATLVAQGREEEGLLRHQDAQAAAERGAQQPDPMLAELCGKLSVQARMAHGAALIGLQRYNSAAPLFEQAAPLAAAQRDFAMAMDCQRLGSFCHEQAGEMELAWQAAVRGLEVARELDVGARKLSNFASLGEALLRMAGKRPASTARPVLDLLAQLQREPPRDVREAAGEARERA